MEKTSKDPIEEIEDRLAGLRPVAPRDPERHAAGRAAFLQQAQALKAAAAANAQRDEKSSKNSFERPVSNVDRKRLIGWNSVQETLRNIWHPNQFWTKKEHPAMFTPIVTVLIVVTLLFGGAGATAYAAQDSLPADALYPVKTMTEDLRLNLSPAEQERLNLALSYAERRVGEIEALVGLDLPLSAGVVSRLGEQVEEALRLAAGMPEQARAGALAQVATRVNAMAGVLGQLQGGAGDQPLLTQASLTLHEQASLAQMGLTDPQRLQERLRERAQTRPWDVDDNPSDGSGNDDGGNANGNGNDNGNGSNANGNDANGNGDNANGNGDDANSNAGDDNGNGDDTNGNDTNGNGGDDNGNGDDANGNGDDANGNGDDANGNGGDANGNGDDANGNGNDDDANDNGGSGGDDSGGNGNDDGGSGGDDNGGNGNDDGGSGGDDNGGSSNDDGGSSGDDNGGSDDKGGGGNGNGNDDDSVTSLPSLINVALRLLAAA